MKIFTRLLFGIFWVTSLNLAAQEYNSSNFGIWKSDKDTLPCFELNFRKQQCPWYPFSHFQGTGYNSVLTNQWGDVDVFTTENGLSNLTPSLWFTRGGFYPMIEINGELFSLIISELDSQRITRYGIGYTEYSGVLSRGNSKIRVTRKITTPFDKTKGFFAEVEVVYLSKSELSGTLSVNSDVWIKPSYNDFEKWKRKLKSLPVKEGQGIVSIENPDTSFRNISLVGPDDFVGKRSENTIKLFKPVTLKSGMKEVAVFHFSFNEDEKTMRRNLKNFNQTKSALTWKKEIRVLNEMKNGDWTDRENIWTYSQLLGMCFYDKSLKESFIHLGGYGIGENPAEPGTGFSMREVAETSIVLSWFNPELARSSLRWMARLQLKSGDMKRGHFHFPLVYEDENQRLDRDFPNESDTEIWFLIACGEYFRATRDTTFFHERIPFRTKNAGGTLWEHMLAAKNFIQKDIGTGKNGLIKMLHGDWNDYLSRIGSEGNGQSLMNTGMMCRALLNMVEISGAFNDGSRNGLGKYLDSLQKAVTDCFCEDQFIRAFDDQGNAVGGCKDRLFINAQSWAALGQCGVLAQRKKALLNAVKSCSTPIGMTLMSKPYSSPTKDNISWAPISAGEGENAGIWPQTVAWMVWALAEEGLTEVAMNEWKKNTLANHTEVFPEVPFGIFNGPDCYSSHFAKEREGWTQVELFNRMIPIPMNPIIAWQAFGMKQIKINKGR